MSSPGEAASALAGRFLRFAIGAGLLQLGDFTTKSGRRSPYFFNTGLADDGYALSRLAGYYLDAAEERGIRFDSLFGGAYKGIPLAAGVAAAKAMRDGLGGAGAPRFAFDRKEEKGHGDGGRIVGRLRGATLIVDDVITSGASVRAAAELVRRAGAEVCGALVALDRGERASDDAGETAAAALAGQIGAPVHAIAGVGDLRALLEEEGRLEELALIDRHLERYGAPCAGG